MLLMSGTSLPSQSGCFARRYCFSRFTTEDDLLILFILGFFLMVFFPSVGRIAWQGSVHLAKLRDKSDVIIHLVVWYV